MSLLSGPWRSRLGGPWPVRVAWAALPLTVGATLGDGLADTSHAVPRVGAVLAWTVWTGGLLAVALPRALSLTALRTAAPAVGLSTVWAASRGEPGAGDIAAVAWAALVVVVAFSPFTGDAFVDGSSYGPERRFALRPPTAVLLGPLEAAWLATVAPLVAGPLLLADERWVAGATVLVLGVPLAVVGGRALHGLSRRWLVFVPAGLVVHDPAAVADPVMVPRGMVADLRPAPADTEALDLTGGAFGLALELATTEPLAITLVTPRAPVTTTTTDQLLVTPTRPGAVLAEARTRRLAVGA